MKYVIETCFFAKLTFNYLYTIQYPLHTIQTDRMDTVSCFGPKICNSYWPFLKNKNVCKCFVKVLFSSKIQDISCLSFALLNFYCNKLQYRNVILAYCNIHCTQYIQTDRMNGYSELFRTTNMQFLLTFLSTSLSRCF